MATDRLGDMRLFVEAAALGSLSAAGRKLGLSPAAASARLIKLEAALHTKLFDRTTRQLRLTEEGRFYLQHCGVVPESIANSIMRDKVVFRRIHPVSASPNPAIGLYMSWNTDNESPLMDCFISMLDSNDVGVQAGGAARTLDFREAQCVGDSLGDA